MRETINQTQAAAFTSLSARRLQQLDAAGEGPSRDASGRYPCDRLGDWFRERVHADIGVSSDGQAYDYAVERARLTKAQADKVELEADHLRADLVRTPIVEQHWEAVIADLRGKLRSLPSRIAARVASPDRAADVEKEAHALVQEALSEVEGDAIPAETRARAKTFAEVVA